MTPAERALAELAIGRSRRINEELRAKMETGSPGIYATMFVRARNQAAEALLKLMTVNAEEPAEIRALQNRAERYLDMVEWVQEAIALGEQAKLEIQVTEEDVNGVREDIESWRMNDDAIAQSDFDDE